MSEIYILDGYNVIGKIPRLREVMFNRGLAEARNELVMMLSHINHSRRGIKFKVVFDGKAEKLPYNPKTSLHGIDCFFTKSGEEADDYIGTMLRNRKDNSGVVVISGDNKVRNKCRVYGASTQEPLVLQKLVGKQSRTTKNTQSDEKNIQQRDASDITKWYAEQLKKRDVIICCIVALTAAFLIFPVKAGAANLEVGPEKAFETIEEAYDQAGEGDVIAVYPQNGGQPYEKSALRVKKKNITFRAAAPGVKISGKGFNYTGKGPTPRAIFQFDEGADNCVVEGFELFGSRNDSRNGAGIRISGANDVLITGCDIHDNDMGIMSNGDGTGRTGVNQRIEYCRIHDNGIDDYSHNLYLDGESAVVSFCEISDSRAGHNLKSRAHFILVQYCYIHDAANRELDFVDSKETLRPRSDAVLVGNIIVKYPLCKGNKQVINFGQDGQFSRTGTIYLVQNTIVTPFGEPMLALSSAGARANLMGNFVFDGGRGGGGSIAGAFNSGELKNVAGEFNAFSRGFSFPNSPHLLETSVFEWIGKSPFKDSVNHDYRPAYQLPRGWPATLVFLPNTPAPIKYDGEGLIAWQYKHPADKEERPPEDRLTAGAYSYVKD